MLRQTFEAHTDITEPHCDPNQATDRLNLLALAVMLLELNLGAPIENFREQEGEGLVSGGDATVSDLLTARKLLELQVRQGKLTSGFRRAITYCLQCYLDPTASLGNDDFVRSVERLVLEPLEREMQVLL